MTGRVLARVRIMVRRRVRGRVLGQRRMVLNLGFWNSLLQAQYKAVH